MKNKNKIKLGFIVRNLTGGGVDRCIFNILDSFDKLKKIKHEIWIIYMDRNAKFINGKKINESFKNLNKMHIPGSNIFIWDYIQLPCALLKKNFDVLIYPKNHIPLTNKMIKNKKYNIVLDLLDFNPDISPNRKLNSLYNRIFLKLSCRIVDRILAISQSTKNEIIDKLNISPSKIDVTWLAVEEKFKVLPKKSNILKRTKEELELPKNFILYIGSDVPRKNLKRVAEAFKKIMMNVPHSLILVGKSVKGLHRELSEKNKIEWKGYVTEEELIGLYNLADLFVFPSLYEGFGLPILEAQACGCPVLISNVTSCPEVAGDSAHLVNPYSINEIADGMTKILTNKDYKNELITKGNENIKRFSWTKTVKKILNINNESS